MSFKYYLFIALLFCSSFVFGQLNGDLKKKESQNLSGYGTGNTMPQTGNSRSNNSSVRDDKLPQREINRNDYYSTWTHRTAKVVPLREIHLSAVAPSRYGNFPKTEINTQLLLFPLVPNIGLKHQWIGETTILSTQHSFNYPTMGLRWAKKSGFGDILPESSVVPHIFAFRNEVIVSHVLNPQAPDCFNRVPDLILTGRMGFDFALKTGDEMLPLIDTRFLYHRTSIYHDRKLYFMGLELDGNTWRNINFSINADYYNIDFNGEYAFESEGRFIYHHNSRLNFSLGYKLSYLNCDYGTQLFVMPMIDLVYKLHHHVKLQNGLFGRKRRR
ncbi:MAG: hypothetical protein ACEPOZ_05505 [Marinifilaceae bacterium]